MSITMLAPAGVTGKVQASQSTSVYSIDAKGQIYNVAQQDVLALLSSGFSLLDGVAQPWLFGGSNPAAPLSTFLGEGNLYRNIGNPIGANGASTADWVLGGVQIPAGAFDVSGRSLTLTAQGATAANTNNKRFKCFINPVLSGATVNADGSISGGTVTSGTVIGDSGAWVNGTTPNSAVGWQLIVDLAKYGAAGSNTQYSQGSPILGALHGGVSPPVFLTLTESAVINLVITGSSYTTGAAADVLLQYLQINTTD